MISLRQLRYLQALSKHLHFGRAAESVSVSQPALSMQIRELETYLGITLVERQSNAVHLTREGQEVMMRAERILAEVRDLVDYARQVSLPLSGPLRLGIIPSIAPYLLPKVLPKITKTHPDLELTIRETLTETLSRELQTGDLDAVIAALPMDGAGLVSAEIFEDRFLLARKTDPTIDPKKRAEVCDLDGTNLLLLEEGHCLRDQALNYCQNIPSPSRNTLGATSLATVIQMVAAGYGVTLLPEICADVEVRDERVLLQRFAEPQPRRMVGLIWRKSSPRHQDFEVLAETLSGLLNA
ncbi:MAG: LysR family transcriptional regulator [Rhodobacteraceae bacterium]|nr:LysR family transcriptional regulator [Paracoccaceae bacterium]